MDLFVKKSKKIKTKSILLIRLDSIGDYVLFRNYIEELKKNEKYKDYSITLLGNNVWKSLSIELDRKYIDNFIWLDRNKFNKNVFYLPDSVDKNHFKYDKNENDFYRKKAFSSF